ncbi:hypothetical protein D1007_09621 [Hordeum vulgare]|nr:hypothetical protein D1007_09621 [Hordeum vulgare]
MVRDQLREYKLKQCKKKLRFESDSNEYAKKEKQRRATDGAEGAKFGKFKKRLSSVAEEGGTPRWSPRVACMDKNLRKRAADVGSQDPQRERPHVSEGPNSGDDDFVLVDFVRDVYSARRKYGFPSMSQPKRPCDDGDDDADADSDGEADAAPKRKNTSKSKGTVDDGEGDYARFNKTVRLSLPIVCKVVALLKEAHRNRVWDAGFGAGFELTLKKNVSRILMCYLMGVIDPATMTMYFGNDMVLRINRAAVHHNFGFPMGSRTAPMHATSALDESLSTIKDELGFRRSQSIGVKDLVQKLAELVEDDDHVTIDLAIKVFFMILYQNLLCPGPTFRLGRVATMVANMDYAAMAQMDFFQLVVDELHVAVVKW